MTGTPVAVDRIVTLLVDVQNDFCPGGALAVRDGDAVVPPLNRLSAFTRSLGGTVVATGDQHPPSTPHFDVWPVHCVAGTPGAQLRADLQVLPGDLVLDKGMGQTDGYSAFEGRTRDGRTLAEVVAPAPGERVAVVVGGLATDYCVLTTVRDALDQAATSPQGRLVVVAVRDAMRPVDVAPGDGDRALAAMAEAGAVVADSEDVLAGRVLRRVDAGPA